jgi:outer membrane receptor protein involved in Fe transport
MKFTKLYLFILFSAISLTSYSQNSHSISGIINEANGNGMAFANVLLLKSIDSTLVKGTLTLDNGTYKFESETNDNYLIMTSLVGFQSVYSKPFTLSQDYTVEPLVLAEGEQLGEVLVQYKKPLYEQKIDRMVINVENSIVSAGSSALEVLERSPGVSVNRQNSTLSLVGKNGVVVMINGKESYMPQSSLVQLLEGMSSDNIASIELITTPPANFDAEGNAGYINIVLKKQTDVGLNGAYSLSGGIGNGTTTSENISFNYRKNRLNLFGNYSFLRQEQGQTFTFKRNFINENNIPSFISTVSDRDPIQRNHNIRLGLDLQLSDKTVIGGLISAYDNKWTMEALNLSEESENNFPTAYVELFNTERNQWSHFGSNLNLKHNFEANKFISFNMDYLHYKDENPTDYTNSFFDGNKNFLNEELTKSNKTTPINIVVGKADYSNQLNDEWKIETGIKGAFSNFENDVLIENFDGQEFVEDPSLTNFSNLDERILAAYASADYKLNDKTSLKLGLRYEHINSQLDTDTQGKVVDRQSGNLFPSAFISHKVNDTLSFNLSYSKRITRPTFNDIAPFLIFFDPTTFFAGNPAIQSSISNSIKFDVNYRSLILSAQYSIEDESISRFQPQFDEENDRLIYKSANIDKTKVFAITLGVPVTITNWWKLQNNLIFLNTKVEDNIDGLPLNFKQSSFNFNNSQSFNLAENLTAELDFYYSGPRLSGSTRRDGIYGMNIGVQKKFSDKWGRLLFSVRNIWDSLDFKSNTNIPEQNLNARRIIDFQNRTFSLTYSRNFGNRDLKSQRDRETGAEEERRRVN